MFILKKFYFTKIFQDIGNEYEKGFPHINKNILTPVKPFVEHSEFWDKIFYGDYKNRAEQIINNVYILPSFDEPVEMKPDKWVEVLNKKTKDWQWRYHTLNHLYYLIKTYENTTKIGYIEKSFEIIHIWEAEFIQSKELNIITWDDHSITLRLVSFIMLYNSCLDLDSSYIKSELDFLLNLIILHAEICTSSYFYRKRTNHGLDQALALLYAGIYVNIGKNAKKWIKTGLQRLKQQIKDNVSPKGVQKELSSWYQFMTLGRFLNAYILCKKNNVILDNTYTNRLLKMMQYGTYLIMPDGKLPTIGDAIYAVPSVLHWPENDLKSTREYKSLIYTVTKGEEGERPDSCTFIDESTGTVVFRSLWGNESYNESTFLYFDAGTRPHAHEHRDALSFQLFSGGQYILNGPGIFDYSTEFREYATSTRAHNTITVDGKEQTKGDAELIQCKTREKKISNKKGGYSFTEYAYATGRHNLYRGVMHQRSIFFIYPDDFFIIDQLFSKEKHEYSHHLHLDPSLSLEEVQGNKSINIVNGNGAMIATANFLMPQYFESNEIKGELDPIQGWTCYAAWEDKTPSICLTHTQVSSFETYFVTHFYLQTSKSTVTDILKPNFTFNENESFCLGVTNQSKYQITFQKMSVPKFFIKS